MLGRSDDMIQTGGENVHPRAVEDVIAAPPGVSECAVFGARHEVWGEQVCAAIVPSSDDLTVEQVIAHCREHLANYQVPKQVLLLDALPRTTTGKVLRGELVQSVAAVSV